LPPSGDIESVGELGLAASRAMLRAGPSDTSEAVSELLYNERVDILQIEGDWREVSARTDGYRGWMRGDALEAMKPAPSGAATLRCRALGSFGYQTQDLRGPSLWVSFGTRIEVCDEAAVKAPRTGEDVRLLRDAQGLWFPARHFGDVMELGAFAGFAKTFLGTPYLWGGRTSRGLDCSALVQLALDACGRSSPRDTSQQVLATGEAVDIHSIKDLREGDLLFWPGHVAIYLAEGQAVHADGVSMAVRIEAIEAIAANRHSSLDKMTVRRPV